jgi:hypothetical protein
MARKRRDKKLSVSILSVLSVNTCLTGNRCLPSTYQGCQMVCFITKNPNLGKFWRAIEWKMLVYVMVNWNILGPFSNVVVIWYTYLTSFGYIVSRKIWQPWYLSQKSRPTCSTYQIGFQLTAAAAFSIHLHPILILSSVTQISLLKKRPKCSPAFFLA